jgi:hypothetical protein
MTRNRRLPLGWTLFCCSAVAVVAFAMPSAAGATVCLPTAPHSPYPGWVEINDDLGVPSLYPIGSAAERFTECATATASADEAPAQAFRQLDPPLKSPYPGWRFVYDDLGLASLEQIPPSRRVGSRLAD